MCSHVTISLRRLDVAEPLPVLVECISDEDVATQAEYIDPETALNQFVEATRRLLPITETVDVWIGAWGQNKIVFPKEFIELIAETGWEVTVDIDD